MKSYQPSPNEVAILVVIMIQRYAKDRGRDISRFRFSRNSFRRLSIRNRLRDGFVDAWVDIMAFDHGWLVFVDEEEFLLQKREAARSWTKIATKRCDDLVKRLRQGDVSAIADAEGEVEDINAVDDTEADD